MAPSTGVVFEVIPLYGVTYRLTEVPVVLSELEGDGELKSVPCDFSKFNVPESRVGSESWEEPGSAESIMSIIQRLIRYT